MLLRSYGAVCSPGRVPELGAPGLVVVKCGRKNDFGPTKRQTQKSYDDIRRFTTLKDRTRKWNQQVRFGSEVAKLEDIGKLLVSEDQAVGQVISAQANLMVVLVEQVGGETQAASENGAHMEQIGEEKVGAKLTCVVRALLKKLKRRVMVGDKVLVSGITWPDKRGMIEEVFERKSEISDPPVANVDKQLILFSLDRPRLEPTILNRFLVEAESTEIPFTVVLNKADLVTEKMKQEWVEKLKDWGYEPHVCSVETGIGLPELGPLLEERTSVVFGPSGVGKSSLINALRNKSLANAAFEMQQHSSDRDDEILRVKDVSRRTGAGRHTTRHVSLIQLPFKGAIMADTPGFSYPRLTLVSSSTLPMLFPEVRSRLGDSEDCCRFAGCKHLVEPGCVVGSDWERHGFYADLWDEVKKREEHEKFTFGTKQEGETKLRVKESGQQMPEPRLELKKHRRISRKEAKQSFETGIDIDLEPEWEAFSQDQ